MNKWQGWVVFIVALTYMIVNETERIATKEILDNYIKDSKEMILVVEKNIEDTRLFSKWHMHRYHDGKAIYSF